MLMEESFSFNRKKGGKADGKKAKKDASIKSMSEANTKLWEARLDVAEKSRTEYRWAAHCMSSYNGTWLHEYEFV
jgi:hypothetical protein